MAQASSTPGPDAAIQAGKSGDLQPTGTSERSGRSSKPIRVKDRMKWRKAAGRLFAAAAARRASVRTTVVLRAYPAKSARIPAATADPVMSASFLAGLFDELRKPAIIVLRKVLLGNVEESGYDALCRPVEECPHKVGEGVPPGLVFGQPGSIDVAGPVLPVDEMPLLLEDAEEGADGRVARRRRQTLQNLKDGGSLQLIDDVHDLSLPPA
jgi:hypothetical protein